VNVVLNSEMCEDSRLEMRAKEDNLLNAFFFLLNGEGNNFQVSGPGSFFVTSSFVITPFLKNDFFFSFNESKLNLREICGRVKCQRCR
jgi:hypothetical protein